MTPAPRAWQVVIFVDGLTTGGFTLVIERSVPGYVAEEERLLAMGRNNLLRSLGRIARNDPRMLIYVGDGFDLEPEEFYLRALRVSGAALTIDPQLLRADAESKTKQANVELGKALAVQGWTTVTVGGSNATMAVVDDASRSRTMSRGPAAGTHFTFVDRGAPLVALAEETGGRRIADARKLGTAVRDAGRRVLITYQIDREPDPRPRRLEISARRPGITVRAPKWVSSTTPEGTAEARALDLMEGGNPVADLAVDATLLSPAEDGAPPLLEVSIDLAPLKEVAARQAATKMRITTAVEIPGDAPAVIHQIADVEDFAGTSTYVWRAPIRLPDSVGAIAVVAEELTSGAWGGARAGSSPGTASSEPAPVAPPAVFVSDGDRATAFARAASERKLVLGAPDRGGPMFPGARGRVPTAGGADPHLEKIAYESGGRAWRIRRGAGDLDAIYRAIELELRNQYRLTYRTAPGGGADDWREVKVSVDVPGAIVRTAAGFVAR